MIKMRVMLATVIVGAALMAGTIASAQPRPAAIGGGGRSLFISPMGEPFRGSSRKEMLRAWFDGADTNRDAALSQAEMRSDGERFFAVLNSNKDREIDPSELRAYEQQIAPEIQVGIDSVRAPSVSENPNASKAKRESVRRGAGIYGLLSTPNPVASADTNFNRGISAEEFARAARDRFAMLDGNRDGTIRFDELPSLPSR